MVIDNNKQIHPMLRKSLLCLNHLSIYILPLWVCGSNLGSEYLGSNPNNEIFDFIKISTQIKK